MKQLLIHPYTQRRLAALLQDPPHALLLIGPTGIGKFTVAERWAKKIAPVSQIISPDEKQTIAIDTVRNLYRQTRGRNTDRQVIIIDHAHTMGIEAQNAFLKLLEEPRPGVIFILTAPTPALLLPTITSRTQTIAVQPINKTSMQKWILAQASLDQKNLAQVLFIAQGRPATAAMLLQNPQFFTHGRALMELAKKIISSSTYDRLAIIPTLIKDRTQLTAVLEAMAHILALHIRANPDPRLMHLADGLQICLERLSQNANPRAQLTNLFMIY